jgi:hypothetical protein
LILTLWRDPLPNGFARSVTCEFAWFILSTTISWCVMCKILCYLLSC